MWLRWSVLFFIFALCFALSATLLGFSGIVGTAAVIARSLFFVFFGAFVASVVIGRPWRTRSAV